LLIEDKEDGEEEKLSVLDIKTKWARGIKTYRIVNGMFQSKD